MEEKICKGFTAPNRNIAIEEINSRHIDKDDIVAIHVNDRDNETTVFYYGAKN